MDGQIPLFDDKDGPRPGAAPDVAGDPGADARRDAAQASTARAGEDDAIPGRPRADSPLGAAAEAFDLHLAREGKTANTRRAFGSDLRLLAERLGAEKPVGSIGREDLERFLSWLLEGRGRPCSAKTYARRVTTLKVFFAWLQKEGAREDDPAAGLVHRRAMAPLPLVLTDDEVARLLAEAARRRTAARAADARPELLVRLLLDTGLKKGELSALRDADVSAEARPPQVLVRYDDPRWAEKERSVAFDAALLPVLAAYRAAYRPQERLFACTARNLEYVLAELVRSAELPPRCGFETLRWTSALRAWRAGVDEEAIRLRLGLSPITWSQTRRKLELLAPTAGPAKGVSERFPSPVATG